MPVVRAQQHGIICWSHSTCGAWWQTGAVAWHTWIATAWRSQLPHSCFAGSGSWRIEVVAVQLSLAVQIVRFLILWSSGGQASFVDLRHKLNEQQTYLTAHRGLRVVACTDTVATLIRAAADSAGETEALLEELMDKHQPTLPVAIQQVISLAQTPRVPGSQQVVAALQLPRSLARCIRRAAIQRATFFLNNVKTGFVSFVVILRLSRGMHGEPWAKAEIWKSLFEESNFEKRGKSNLKEKRS